MPCLRVVHRDAAVVVVVADDARVAVVDAAVPLVSEGGADSDANVAEGRA